MAADVDALERTQRWVRSRFARYYAHAELDLPARFTKREWAFLFFDKSYMVRHLSFGKRDQLRAYLRDQAPKHAYYSTAFYEDPGAHTMLEKGWRGATLVFDLDSDHLRNASKMTYEEMLSEVKKEFRKLIDKWLIRKFGFDSSEIQIVFSGGRGYHAHIENPKVLELSSYERREIVDKITGKNIEKSLDTFIQKVSIASRGTSDGRKFSTRKYTLPSPKRGNWEGDLSAEIVEFFIELLNLIEAKKKPEAIRIFSELYEIDEVKAIYYIERLLDSDVAGNRKIDWLIRHQYIDFEEGLGPAFWKPFLKKLHVQLIGETDEPVTGDIKRLIRMPGSLHGKTGFQTKKISYENLDTFNPLIDAIAFNQDPIEVVGLSDASFLLKDETYHIENDKIFLLPEYAAIFAILRGQVFFNRVVH